MADRYSELREQGYSHEEAYWRSLDLKGQQNRILREMMEDRRENYRRQELAIEEQEKRMAELMEMFQGRSDIGREDIKRAYEGIRSQIRAGMTQRGMAPTSVMTNLMAGNRQEELRDITRYGDQRLVEELSLKGELSRQLLALKGAPVLPNQSVQALPSLSAQIMAEDAAERAERASHSEKSWGAAMGEIFSPGNLYAVGSRGATTILGGMSGAMFGGMFGGGGAGAGGANTAGSASAGAGSASAGAGAAPPVSTGAPGYGGWQGNSAPSLYNPAQWGYRV